MLAGEETEEVLGGKPHVPPDCVWLKATAEDGTIVDEILMHPQNDPPFRSDGATSRSRRSDTWGSSVSATSSLRSIRARKSTG